MVSLRTGIISIDRSTSRSSRMCSSILVKTYVVTDSLVKNRHEQTLWCSFCGRTTYFLLHGSLLTVSTISRVVVIHLNQP
jgi:hypothetical protein